MAGHCLGITTAPFITMEPHIWRIHLCARQTGTRPPPSFFSLLLLLPGDERRIDGDSRATARRASVPVSERRSIAPRNPSSADDQSSAPGEALPARAANGQSAAKGLHSVHLAPVNRNCARQNSYKYSTRMMSIRLSDHFQTGPALPHCLCAVSYIESKAAPLVELAFAAYAAVSMDRCLPGRDRAQLA